MAQTQQTKFVRRVRRELAAQELSVRGLARRMDPENIDRARRNLHRWLDGGITPSRSSVVEIADALGVDPAELDEEERDPMADLMSAIERLVRRQVEAVVRA